MKYFAIILIALVLGACSGSSTPETKETPTDKPVTTGSTDQTDGAGNKDTEEAIPAEELKPKSKDAKASREEIEAKDSATKGLGPTDTVRAFNDAILQKDSAKIQSFLSRNSIDFLRSVAKQQKTSIDQILTTDGVNTGPMPTEREMKNEQIKGNTATVEVKNTTLGSFDVFPLVKEDGFWRIDLEKQSKDNIRKLNKIMKDVEKLKS